MDLAIDQIDDKGCMGAFVMSRQDGTTYPITFVFDGNAKQLLIHPDANTTNVVLEFRTVFFTDVEECWLKWVRAQSVLRATKRRLDAATAQQWAVN